MTHWKKLNNPDYLGAYALDTGQEPILRIKSITREMVIGEGGKQDECTVAHFSDDKVKPMILNATNCKTITKIHGTPQIEQWQGKLIQVYVKIEKIAGEPLECLRIRPIAPKEPTATKEALTPEHARWSVAVNALASGATTIAGITKTYSLSETDKAALVEAASNVKEPDNA